MHTEGIYPSIFMGKYPYGHSPVIEPEPSMAKLEALCAHMLKEVWDNEGGLVEERDLKLLEERGVH
jgi:hypothetical protein